MREIGQAARRLGFGPAGALVCGGEESARREDHAARPPDVQPPGSEKEPRWASARTMTGFLLWSLARGQHLAAIKVDAVEQVGQRCVDVDLRRAAVGESSLMGDPLFCLGWWVKHARRVMAVLRCAFAVTIPRCCVPRP